MAPGEMQLWRIANIGASMFMKFAVADMTLRVIARGGRPLRQPNQQSTLFLGPGERVDAIAVGPAAGEYAMATVPFQNEGMAGGRPEPTPGDDRLNRLTGGRRRPGHPIARQRAVGGSWIDEVVAAPIARRRTLEYCRNPDRKLFTIDGRVMDESRVDQTVWLGGTEEWTIAHTDQQYHSFHIHQTALLVTEINGVPQAEDSLRDTWSVPQATEQTPAILKIIIPFTDPIIVGRFVYHCHAVDHEDKGMMGVIDVIAYPATSGEAAIPESGRGLA
jgi:FtsP/CotA-like multicopper oxidase with cupredoxin domain